MQQCVKDGGMKAGENYITEQVLFRFFPVDHHVSTAAGEKLYLTHILWGK